MHLKQGVTKRASEMTGQSWELERMMDQLMSAGTSSTQRLGTGTIVVLLTVLISLWILRATRKKVRGVVYPPGAVGLLHSIWDTFAFFKCHGRNELKSFFDQKAAKYGPIFKLSLMGETVVLLDPPAGNKFLLGVEYSVIRKAYPKSVTDLSAKNSLLCQRGEAHKLARRHLMTTFFGPDSMLRYVQSMESNALEHFKNHWLGKEETGEEVDTHSTITQFTLEFILDVCFGLTGKSKKAELEKLSNAFEIWAHGLLSLPIRLPGFAFHRALKAKTVLFASVADLIVQRRKDLKAGDATPEQDLLSVLLTQPDGTGQVWTDEHIRDNLLLLLYAGHDTTSSTLTMTISNIAKHPEVYRKLIDEHARIAATKGDGEPLTMDNLRSMTYTWQVVQETMRQTTIVPLSFRQATEDFEYHGYTILKGWKIFHSQDRVNMQPAFFDNPDRFEPERFTPARRPGPFVFLPFGAGPRSCPGMEFAKLEILIFLHHFLKNFKWTLVHPDEKVIRVYMPRTEKGSPIRLTRCKAF